jgi:hypothetical protein
MKTPLVFLIILVSVVGASSGMARDKARPPTRLWKGIVAEVSTQEEMIAVACIVRNRLEKNMTIGLVAMDRPDLDEFVAKEKPSHIAWAKKAVAVVFNNRIEDITGGSDHFEDICYRQPRWARGMKKIKQIGNVVCYRSGR